MHLKTFFYTMTMTAIVAFALTGCASDVNNAPHSGYQQPREQSQVFTETVNLSDKNNIGQH